MDTGRVLRLNAKKRLAAYGVTAAPASLTAARSHSRFAAFLSGGGAPGFFRFLFPFVIAAFR
jgi:hypothetical protein